MIGVCRSQETSTEVLLKHVSRANAGTEFWVTFPPCYEEVTGAENTTRILIASPVKQPVTVEVPGKGYSVTKMVAANEVTEFKMPSNIGQAYSKPTQGKAPAERIYQKCGVHITTESPIVVYGMTRFQYTADGFLALPVSKLGTDYIIASWPQYIANGSSYKLPAVSNIVAAYDGTEVTFTMGGPVGSRTTGGLKIGQSKKWTLNEGDVLCFANDDDGQDIAGSRVVSNKPVGIVSGNQCANVPAGVAWCDFIDEMELPIKTWGKEYHVTPIVERMYNPTIRVFAHPKYKDIKVYRDGVLWKTLTNKSRIEGEAFFESRVYEGMPHSTIITASAPIYVMLYNNGQADDNVASDPFQMALTPIEQYQKEIVLSTPNAKGSTLPFTRNFANIMYPVGDGNVVPQDLEFATIKDGKFEWRTVASRFGAGPGQLLTTRSSNGLQYAMKRIQLPGDGVFRIRCKNPIALYSYGHSDYDAYGYPAGVELRDLSLVGDVVPPDIIVNNESSGVWRGITEDFIVKNLDNMSASVRGIITSMCLTENSTNVTLVHEKITAIKTAPIAWNINVVDPTQNGYGVVVVSDNSGNYSYKEFKYTASDTANLRMEVPKEITLNITKNDSVHTTVTVKNSNKVFPITVMQCTISDTKNFAIQTNAVIGKTLNPEEEITLPFTLKAKNAGDYTCTISCTTSTNRITEASIVAHVVKSGLESSGMTIFDTLQVGNTDFQTKDFLLKAAIGGAFAAPTTITTLTVNPPNTISLDGQTYGTEGFSVDTSLFMNKELIPGVNEVKVPVNFKPVKQGVHFASLSMYIGQNKLGLRKEFVGYGKILSSVNEQNINIVNVFTDITAHELILQGELFGNWEIYNHIGDRILSGIIPEVKEVYSISIQNLSAGMYIFETTINGKKVQEKFVVMR